MKDPKANKLLDDLSKMALLILNLKAQKKVKTNFITSLNY